MEGITEADLITYEGWKKKCHGSEAEELRDVSEAMRFLSHEERYIVARTAARMSNIGMTEEERALISSTDPREQAEGEVTDMDNDVFIGVTFKHMIMAIANATLNDLKEAGSTVCDIVPETMKPFLNIQTCRGIAGMGFIAGTVYGTRMERARRKS